MLPKALIDGVNEDVDKLAYSFTLKYQEHEVQQYVQFISQKNTPKPVSSGVLTLQDVSSDYYYINSFQYFINLLNTALSDAYTALNTLSGGSLGTYPPFLTYSEGLLIMNADVLHYDNALDNPIYIYVNSAMYELLNGFLTSESKDLTNGKNYLIQMINNGNTISLENYDSIPMIQEYSSMESWCPVQSILITTNNIPVYPEVVGNPNVFEPKQEYNTNANQNLNIITNFSVNLDNPTAYLPSVSYSTTNNYRYIDLMQSQHLTNIDIKVYWRDKYSRIHPLYLLPQTSSYFDLVFINRNLTIN